MSITNRSYTLWNCSIQSWRNSFSWQNRLPLLNLYETWLLTRKTLASFRPNMLTFSTTRRRWPTSSKSNLPDWKGSMVRTKVSWKNMSFACRCVRFFFHRFACCLALPITQPSFLQMAPLGKTFQEPIKCYMCAYLCLFHKKYGEFFGQGHQKKPLETLSLCFGESLGGFGK